MNFRNFKVIETKYNGYKFRSRLEARWAVFFDYMGVKYFYEHEGYDLDEHGRYLPDFHIPNAKIILEVKPALELISKKDWRKIGWLKEKIYDLSNGNYIDLFIVTDDFMGDNKPVFTDINGKWSILYGVYFMDAILLKTDLYDDNFFELAASDIFSLRQAADFAKQFDFDITTQHTGSGRKIFKRNPSILFEY